MTCGRCASYDQDYKRQVVSTGKPEAPEPPAQKPAPLQPCDDVAPPGELETYDQPYIQQE